MSIAHETTIRLIGILTTTLGSSLNPFVSSSKNLIKPPLEAGSGADFFLLLMANFEDQDFDLKTLLIIKIYYPITALGTLKILHNYELLALRNWLCLI